MNALLAIPDVTNVARALLGWLGQAIAWGTALALLTAVLLVLFGRRLRPSVHAALWLIVLAKFLLPVGPSWSGSLATAAQRLHRSVAAPAVDPAAGAAGETFFWFGADAPPPDVRVSGDAPAPFVPGALHPEADTDGDGVLSDEEMKNLPARVVVLQCDQTGGDAPEGDAQFEIEVEEDVISEHEPSGDE